MVFTLIGKSFNLSVERVLTRYDRHVILLPQYAKFIPKDRLMSEREWRSLGVAQSAGWEHYALHKPEPHILLFRRAADPK
jgi:hypothetical protein